MWLLYLKHLILKRYICPVVMFGHKGTWEKLYVQGNGRSHCVFQCQVNVWGLLGIIYYVVYRNPILISGFFCFKIHFFWSMSFVFFFSLSWSHSMSSGISTFALFNMKYVFNLIFNWRFDFLSLHLLSFRFYGQAILKQTY